MLKLQFPLRKVLLFVAKGAVSLAVIAIVLFHIDRSMVLHGLQQLSPHTVAVLLIILGLQTTAVAGLRLKFLLAGLQVRLPLSATWQVAIGGFFVEQVAFGMLGGDASRVWSLSRLDVPVKIGMTAIALDRLLGLTALLMLALTGLPHLFMLLPEVARQDVVLLGLVLLLVALVAVFFFLAVLSSRKAGWMKEVVGFELDTLKSRGFWTSAVYVFALALLTHVTNVFLLFLVGLNLNMPVGLWSWFLIAPPALLLATLPITSGGWGVREASFIVSLGSLGISPESAIIPSVIFGFSILLVTLPGGIILLHKKRISRRIRQLNQSEYVVPTEQLTLGHSLRIPSR